MPLLCVLGCSLGFAGSSDRCGLGTLYIRCRLNPLTIGRTHARSAAGGPGDAAGPCCTPGPNLLKLASPREVIRFVLGLGSAPCPLSRIFSGSPGCFGREGWLEWLWPEGLRFAITCCKGGSEDFKWFLLFIFSDKNQISL